MPILWMPPMTGEHVTARDPIPYAVQDVRRAVCDFIAAIHAALDAERVDTLTRELRALRVELEAALAVAAAKEETFYPTEVR